MVSLNKKSYIWFAYYDAFVALSKHIYAASSDAFALNEDSLAD